MNPTRTSRAPIRFAAAALTAGLVLAPACSKDGGTASTGTTVAPSGSTGGTTKSPAASTAPASTTTAGPATTAAPATTTLKKQIGNSDVKAALSAEKPELWALVNYDYMSWDAFSGFTIPIPEGTDVAKAIELCEAVSEVVYEGEEETTIVIATGVSADNFNGTPVVERKNKAGSCAAM